MGLSSWFSSRFKKETRNPNLSDKQINDDASSIAPSAAHVHYDKADDKPSASNSHTDLISESQEVWEEAYTLVKNDESMRPIIEEYEAKMLSELQPLSGNAATNASLICDIASLNTDNRKRFMERLVYKEGVSSGRSKAVSQIATVFDSTEQIIGSVLDVYPPASVVWAGVCLVLKPVNLLRSDAWQSSEEYKKFKVPIRKEIVTLYGLVIEYQMLTFQTCNHRIRDFAKNAVGLSQWDEKIRAIISAEKRVDNFLNYDHKTNVLANLLDIKKVCENKLDSVIKVLNQHHEFMLEESLSNERNALIQDFKPNPNQHNYQAYRDYFDHIVAPLEGTNSGIRNDPRYKRWETGEDRLFLILANPGAGKSVFTKSLLQDLENQPESNPSTVCSFFFKDKSGQQNKANVALCKILYELFLAQGNLIDGVRDMVKPLDKEDLRLNLDKLWDIFEAAISQTAPFRSIIILLDALDEVDEDQIKNLLYRLQRFSNPAVKFLLTSRPTQAVLDMFQSQKDFILNMNDDVECNESLSRDVTKVATSRLDTFFRNNKIENGITKAKLRNTFKQHMSNNYTYLFVGLIFDYLDKQPMKRLPSQWIETFTTLPTTVYDTYRALLEDIPGNDRPDVKAMLQLVLAAQRPLTVREMNIALNVCTIDDVIDSTEDMELMQDAEDFKIWILKTCHFFLVTYDNRIHFIHQTVRDYLLPLKSSDDKRPEWLTDDFSEEACHQTIMKTCIKYISAPFIQRPAIASLKDFFDAPLPTQLETQQWFRQTLEFGEYAFTQWLMHLDFIRNREHKEWPEALETVQKQFVFMPFDFAELCFCCSSFPSKREVEVFRDMPLLGEKDSNDHRDLTLDCLAKGLVTRYLKTSISSELHYAISLSEELISRTDSTDARLSRRLIDISRAYLIAHDDSSKFHYVESGLDSAERAVQVTSPGHINRPRALQVRADALGKRYFADPGLTGDDINKAIHDIEEALNTTSPYVLDDQDKAFFLHSKAVYYGYRSRQGTDSSLKDLDKAIKVAREAVDMLSPTSLRRDSALHTLSVWLGARAEETREIEHIDEAIRVDKLALGSVLPQQQRTTSTDHFSSLRGLVAHLLLRYTFTESLEDLRESLEVAEYALRVIPKHHDTYLGCKRVYIRLLELADDVGLEYEDVRLNI
ncbi:hypothetical protein UA08_06176 [Talaromyces atroroseus]|uniref:Uncharacterized protein n=1 Tax=Talaromyces atroroseus TaxID=1441469 RepID=A0A225AC29_TALAT|nr:hypothetical protein UA08_06176 [Talaromyces atroroseus]OKL58612.1 hypothetical protein UA08_06176 [Talaromyces atroroseus]